MEKVSLMLKKYLMVFHVLEERGYHTRTVMGTRNLPNHNIPVEIEVIVEVES